jgi:putative SOS response-associated peptidase YedK
MMALSWCNCAGVSRLDVPRARRLSISVPKDGTFLQGRCLVPASHFFEFTGTKSPKAKWKFTKAAEDWFCFAGLWRPMSQGGEAFTLLTTEPGPDVAPIHNRQMVVLERPDWIAWLDLTRPEAELLRPLPPGSFKVEQVR